jgi:predicted DNA-binding protein (UPF0251 family)
MPRPCKPRRVCCEPEAVSFKPYGMPRRFLEMVTMTLDELEAIRLSDLEGIYQEEAAQSMNVSRQTFGYILFSAHRKIADFIINTKRLNIEGGSVFMNDRSFTCSKCGHGWSAPFGTEKPNGCPRCDSASIHRSEDRHGNGRSRGNSGKPCCGRRQK